ncbi:MAG: glycoside hydrolase family 127 protein [Phycisphaerales bacterium]|nr:glycoside hydrolase family 127 protein [Phycisphaerales bacterium]
MALSIAVLACVPSLAAAVEPHVKPVAIPFGAADVRLLDGPFKEAQDADARYLLSLEADRLLARYRKECGLKPKAQGYGGWEGDRTNAGEHMGVRWRDAYRGSWFSFKMKLPEKGKARLICTYWGSDFSDREFDVLVDDVKVATQVLDRNKPGEFFDVASDIPEALTAGKREIRVKFQAHPRKTAGGVFGCRIVRAE